MVRILVTGPELACNGHLQTRTVLNYAQAINKLKMYCKFE